MKKDLQQGMSHGRNVSERGGWQSVVDVNKFRVGLGRIERYQAWKLRKDVIRDWMSGMTSTVKGRRLLT